jgi:hypothetical protein
MNTVETLGPKKCNDVFFNTVRNQGDDVSIFTI